MKGEYTRPPEVLGAVRLDLNESPWDVDERFREGFLQRLREAELHRYPALDAQPAREEAAKLYRWETEGTLVGNGSNELLANALMVLCQGGKKVLALSPSFSVYPWLVRRAGGTLVLLPLRPPGFDVFADRLLQEATEADVLLLCSPNNPTGNELSLDLWEMVLSLGKPTIWDGAYWEFGTGGEVRPWLSRFPNLVIARTLSKVWGLAGIRAGCLLTSPAFAARIARAMLPFSSGVAVWAAFATAASLPEVGRERGANVILARETLLRELAGLTGVEVVPSRGNFFLFRCPPLNGSQLHTLLAERGVSVRLLEELVAEGFVRVTVGTPEENQRLKEAVEEVVDVAHRAG